MNFEHDLAVPADNQSNFSPIKKIVVLGGGSAGFLVALALAKQLPELETVVVRSTKMGVIGVGEGTIASVVRYLHQFLGINPLRFHRTVHPSIKLGIQYLWGPQPVFHYSFASQFTGPFAPNVKMSLPRGFYCNPDVSFADVVSAMMLQGKVAIRNELGQPRLTRSFAYHLENKPFVDFLEEIASENGIQKIDAIVTSVKRNAQGIEALILDDGQRVEADLFVDCSGFQSELLGQALEEPFVNFDNALYCDRAIVGGWQRTDEVYYAFTTAETMDSGWCWRIEHDEVINRGYVYSSRFISDDDAEAEFRRKNPKVTSTRMLKFRGGVHRRAWVGNVVAIGNAYGFVEPLEATAIGMICAASGLLVKILKSGSDCLTAVQRDVFNDVQDTNWGMIRDFLAIHYKFNTRIQSPFWRACQHDIPLGNAQEIVDYYQAVGPDFDALEVKLRRDIFGAEGYIAMLLGQQVPFRKPVSLSDREQLRWRELKSQMASVAEAGFEMKEYLTLLRNGDAKLPQSVTDTAAGVMASK